MLILDFGQHACTQCKFRNIFKDTSDPEPASGLAPKTKAAAGKSDENDPTSDAGAPISIQAGMIQLFRKFSRSDAAANNGSMSREWERSCKELRERERRREREREWEELQKQNVALTKELEKANAAPQVEVQILRNQRPAQRPGRHAAAIDSGARVEVAQA
jgi:hypothetical protein